MKRTPDLDFAYDRAAHQRWRKALLATLCLVFGLQFGMAAWRWQSLQSTHAALQAQQRQASGKSARADHAELSADQVKAALAAQAMLDSLAVPWEQLLMAIEEAHTKTIVIDAIQPHAEDGSVSISVNCPDFAGVAEFIEQLVQQGMLHDVMLLSETRPENAGGAMHAVINANWRKAK